MTLTTSHPHIANRFWFLALGAAIVVLGLAAGSYQLAGNTSRVDTQPRTPAAVTGPNTDIGPHRPAHTPAAVTGPNTDIGPHRPAHTPAAGGSS